jgi:hypothetical protein
MPTWLHRSGLTASENVVPRPLFLSYPHTGDSMDEKSLFTKFWTDESKTT